MPAIKKMEGFKWLGQIPSQTLQATLEQLNQTYNNFFNGAGFPRWASKYHYNSFTVKSVKIDTHNRLKLPKIGSVKYYASRKLEGKLKRAVITSHGHSWYISLVARSFNSDRISTANKLKLQQKKESLFLEKKELPNEWSQRIWNAPSYRIFLSCRIVNSIFTRPRRSPNP